MKPTYRKPLADDIRQAKEGNVIDDWTLKGSYVIFRCGSASFYVNQCDAGSFLERLIRGQMAADIEAFENEHDDMLIFERDLVFDGVLVQD